MCAFCIDVPDGRRFRLDSGSVGRAVFAGVSSSPDNSSNREAIATGEGTVDVVARVVREGFVRETLWRQTESVEIEAEQLSTGDRVLSAPVGIRLTIFSKRGRGGST